FDRSMVCLYHSNNSTMCPGPLCCTDPPQSDTTIGYEPPHYCRSPWGSCSQGGEVCFEDAECPGGPGVCTDGATACRRDADCAAAGITGVCAGADICEMLTMPWLETQGGNIYSGDRIVASD